MAHYLNDPLESLLDNFQFADEMAFASLATLAEIVGEVCVEIGRADLAQKLTAHLLLASEAFSQRSQG